MKITSLRPFLFPNAPEGLERLEYASSVDGHADWAGVLPGADATTWVVCIHGHGSHGDQLYVRPDVREHWLPRWRARGCGILTPNLRDNAWMSPAAAADMHALVTWLRSERGARRLLFFSGSMGGTSNLIYATLHPEDVSGLAAMGAVSDLASYHSWCRTRKEPAVVAQIADAIERAYGGIPANRPAPYARHSTLAHADQLSMPVFLCHGADDKLMPISQSRDLAERMADRPNFRYVEIPGGNHDSPLWQGEGFDWVMDTL